MGLEAADYIKDLVQANPVEADNVSEGNEHFHTLKRCLQNTLPDSGAAGQFDSDLLLAPSGTTPATGAGTRNAYVDQIDVASHITIGGGIFGSAEVLIAGAMFNPPSITATGASFGFATIDRTGPGIYEFRLIEQAWDINDLLVVFTGAYGLGGGAVCEVTPPVENAGGGWFRIAIHTVDEGASFLDPIDFRIAVFDAGRDV